MLVTFLSQEVFAHLWVFARLGTALMLMIGIGDSYVSPRIRLTFALLLSFVVRPVVDVPVYPDSPVVIVMVMAKEVLIGLFFGMIARMIVGIMDVAGSMIGAQIGLGSAMLFNPAMVQQTGVITVFMTVVAVTAVMVTDLHHLGLTALVDSYHLFHLQAPVMMGDMTKMLLKLADQTMMIGLQLAAPLVVMGLIFNLGVGILARLMPQIQIFFISVPLQIGFGFLALMMASAVIIQVFLVGYEDIYSYTELE
ncbi:MAG: flagellar biosynthetic protein FliR [Alphaproteobacteria bacterium]